MALMAKPLDLCAAMLPAQHGIRCPERIGFNRVHTWHAGTLGRVSWLDGVRAPQAGSTRLGLVG